MSPMVRRMGIRAPFLSRLVVAPVLTCSDPGGPGYSEVVTGRLGSAAQSDHDPG